jgi:hypothetical protein
MAEKYEFSTASKGNGYRRGQNNDEKLTLGLRENLRRCME